MDLKAKLHRCSVKTKYQKTVKEIPIKIQTFELLYDVQIIKESQTQRCIQHFQNKDCFLFDQYLVCWKKLLRN